MSVVDDLSKDPKFLDLSAEAKRLVLSKKDPAFGKLSKQAQEVVIDRLHPVAPLSRNPEATTLAEQVKARQQFLLSTGRNFGRLLSVGAKAVRFASQGMGPAGGAMGEVAAEAAENITGEQRGYSPAKVGAAAATAALPFGGGSALGTAARSAILGPVSETIDSIAEGQGIPARGQLAMSSLTSALFGFVGHKIAAPLMSMLRSSTGEVAPPDLAGPVHDILFGDKIPPNVSPAVREGVSDFRKQLKLPGIKYRPAEPLPMTYRTRRGRYASLDVEAPEVHVDEEPFAQGRLQFPKQIERKRVPKGTESPRSALYFGIPKWWFSRTEQQSHGALPVFREVFYPVDEAFKRKLAFEDNILGQVNEHYKGRDLRGREKIQAGLEHDSSRVAEMLNYDMKDHVALTNVRQAWTNMFRNYGLEDGGAGEGKLRVDEFLTEHWPAMRRAATKLGPDAHPLEVLNEAFPVEVPKSVQYFQDLYKGGRVNFNDTDSLHLLLAHLDQGGYNTFMKQPMQAAAAKYVHGKNVPPEVSSTVNHFLTQVRGGSDPTGNDLAVFMKHAINKLSLGKVNLTKQETKDLANVIISGQYGFTLGGRVAPIVHNSLQTLQTGASELGSYWGTGVRRALTKEGWHAGEQAGALRGEAGITYELQDIAKKVSPSRVSQTAGKLARATQFSLIPYKSMDEFNRMVMYHGQMARVEDAMKKAKGNVELFIDHAWLDSNIFHAAERDRLQKLARDGRLLEAGRQSALALADNTQWVYRAGNRPPATTGTAGRAFGAFLTWGQFYANYLKRMAAPSGGNRAKDAIRFARFVGANAAIAGLSVGFGEAVGNKDAFKRFLTWNLLGPAIPTGSPAIQAAYSGLQAANELGEGDVGGRYQKQFARSIKPFYSPYLATDFLHLIGKRTTSRPPFVEDDPTYQGLGEAVGRITGLQPRLAP